jgi:uncharacterized C2H2 Zn-finger protein
MMLDALTDVALQFHGRSDTSYSELIPLGISEAGAEAAGWSSSPTSLDMTIYQQPSTSAAIIATSSSLDYAVAAANPELQSLAPCTALQPSRGEAVTLGLTSSTSTPRVKDATSNPRQHISTTLHNHPLCTEYATAIPALKRALPRLAPRPNRYSTANRHHKCYKCGNAFKYLKDAKRHELSCGNPSYKPFACACGAVVAARKDYVIRHVNKYAANGDASRHRVIERT